MSKVYQTLCNSQAQNSSNYFVLTMPINAMNLVAIVTSIVQHTYFEYLVVIFQYSTHTLEIFLLNKILQSKSIQSHKNKSILFQCF